MVLKSIIRYIINKYLKDYIEQLDDEKLKVHLRHGNVCLENLHLKPEALVGFGIPVTVATGFIEKLSIVIPWKNLQSHRTKIHLEGLYMLIVPKNEVRQDLSEYHVEKKKRVQRKLDNLRKSILDENKIDEREKGFFEKIKFQMMQNLQLTLQNFHISYETKSTTKLGHPFSFGFTIHSLQLTTTTNNKRIGKMKENTLIIFKIKEINSLSIYWNTNCKSRINQPFEYVVNDLKSKIATNTNIPKSDEMNYILYPVNLYIRIEMRIKFAEINFQRPIVKIICQIQQISFKVDPKQLSDLLDFIKFQNYSVFYDRCREYRQLYPIDNSQLTQQQKDRIHILESKLDVYTLAYIQHSIELEANPSLYQNNGNEYSWWNWWWTGKAMFNQDPHQTTTQNLTTEEESLDIDTVIMINKLELNLLSPPIKNKLIEVISHIIIDNSRIEYKRRTISSSILLVLNLGYFQIFGLKSSSEDRPLMLTSRAKSLNPLIHIELELAPTDKKSDYRFVLILEPLTIIYHAATINQIVSNFDPIDPNIGFLSPQIKQRTFEEMENDLSNTKIFDMKFQIKGLFLLLPEYGFYQQDSKTILVHFDNFMLKSSLNNDKQDDSTLFRKQLREKRYYVKYNLIFNDLGIIYSQSNKEQFRILQSIPLFDVNFYKCIYSDDANLLDWRIAIRVAQMGEMELTEEIYTKLNNHYETVPLFYSTMSETLQRINLFFTIFPPYIAVKCDISVNKCSFRIIYPNKSIQTDFYSHILKTRNDGEYNKLISGVLKNLRMIRHSSVISIQSSWPFYKNNSIELLYSDTDTKL